MTRWRQAKRYRCPHCGMTYLHDQGYAHTLFFCLARLMRLVLITTSSELRIGK
jgi:transposase-like protein